CSRSSLTATCATRAACCTSPCSVRRSHLSEPASSTTWCWLRNCCSSLLPPPASESPATTSSSPGRRSSRSFATSASAFPQSGRKPKARVEPRGRRRRRRARPPAADARVPGRAIHATAAAAAGREARDHGLGAGPRARSASVGRTDRARRLVCRASLAAARSPDPGANAGRALRRNLQRGNRRMARVIFFSGDAVRRAVSPQRAYDGVHEAFIAYARGEWTMPPKVYVPAYPVGDFRAMPALGAGHALLKWVTSFPGNPAKGLPTVTGLVLLSDATDGTLL